MIALRGIYIHHPETIWYIILGLGLLTIFYKKIDEFDFLFLKLKLKEAKEELGMEEEKILLRFFIHNMIIDSNDKNEAQKIFHNQEINQCLKIAQSTDYCLQELEKRGYIKYFPTGAKTNNSTNNSKEIYDVKIIKKIPIN
jgi:hypothetical protein